MALSELEAAAIGFITGQVVPRSTTKMAAKALLVAAVTAGRAASPYVARGAAAALPPVARAVANPYVGLPLATAAGTYGLQQYLEESGQQEAQNVRVAQLMQYLEEDVPAAGRKTKKKIRSTYNKAVSRAMKAVKKSTRDGPKGKFTNAKKTFGRVSKAVSKASKGGKLSSKGVTGVIKRSISGMFKPKPKRRSSTKGSYSVTVN